MHRDETIEEHNYAIQVLSQLRFLMSTTKEKNPLFVIDEFEKELNKNFYRKSMIK